jgi:hypothetical protein
LKGGLMFKTTTSLHDSLLVLAGPNPQGLHFRT